MGDLASAFAAYTRKIKAALDAQNAAQTVVLLAEARIGAELKAAQDRGELATRSRHPGSVGATDTAPITLPELDITRDQAHEMRKLAEVGPEAIGHAAAAATEAGEPITRRAVAAAHDAVQGYTAQSRAAGQPITDRGIRTAIREAVIGTLPPRPERRPEDDLPRCTAAEKQLANDWIDWVGAVEALATIDADMGALWGRAPEGLHRKLSREAQAALPRLQAWIEQMEMQHVEAS